LQRRFFICSGRILIISLSPLIKKFKTNGWVSQLFIVALIGFCAERARAGLKSVAGGLSERMKQIRAECPSNFLRTTLFFVEKGEKEKHRRRIPLFSLALSLWLRAAQLRILDLSRRNLLLREFMCVAAARNPLFSCFGRSNFVLFAVPGAHAEIWRWN
jgi:hypothetical protein